ncbi:uncharacterized protein YciI [Luteibacter sp. Sphag1AF]|uniref:YciI family protein n=1 Tax=Luteibacter sp. Sphag1AF TaxID=2587031 RepID=UPI001621FC6C|nr:YciI family protein [Luteibacter sp. Sphag1AF]MBB3227190.1 uncharacterized protein YciI [Luteibacter sp. Sphag1AF]
MTTVPLNRYLVLAMRTPQFDPEAGQAHRAFIDDLTVQGLIDLTGPFADGTGGAYLLRAPDLATATALVESDPLHITASSVLTIHEWQTR